MNTSEETRETRTPKSGITWVRLLLALIVGVLCGLIPSFLYTHGLSPAMIGLIFLVPLCMGIAAPFVVDQRSKHVLPLGFLLGLLAWFGMGVFLLIWATQQEAIYTASCQVPEAPQECVRGEGELTLGVLFYLSCSFILVIIGALVVGLIVTSVRKNRASRLIS